MPMIIMQVDRENGNYEHRFSYTVDVSLNGIQGRVESCKIRLFFPEILDVFQEDPGLNFEGYFKVQVPGGVVLTYDLGSVEDLGVAISFSVGAQFNMGAVSGDTFTCTPELIINGESTFFSSPKITLLAVGNFVFTREIVLPANPCAGSTVYYRGTVENLGDAGVSIAGMSIVIPGGEGITIDAEYDVVGSDISSSFKDSSADGVTGSVQNNILTFELPAYAGRKYTFLYRAVFAENLNEIVDNASYFIGETEFSDSYTRALSEETFTATLSLYGADHTLVSQNIRYEYTLKNTGNRAIENAEFENTFPADVSCDRFTTGSYIVDVINETLGTEYFIRYESVNGISGTLGPYNTDVNTTVNTDTFLPPGDGIFKLTWLFGALGVGVRSARACVFDGIVAQNAGAEFTNVIRLDYEGGGNALFAVREKVTAVEDVCALRTRFSSSKGTASLRPGDAVRYTIGANCRNSRLSNPVLAMVLPPELVYAGNVSVRYSYVFESINPPVPPASVTSVQEGTLVKFEYTGEYAYDFSQKAVVDISFDTTVAVGAMPGTLQSYMLLGTLASTPRVIGETYSGGVELSSLTDVFAKSNSISNSIMFYAGIRADKKVKGALDSAFTEEPAVGSTFEGGSILYKLTLENIGNATFDSVEIVDVLPHVGDTAVLSSAFRRSEFGISLLSEVTAEVPGQSAHPKILYSKSTDPVRFGGAFNVIGSVDDWSDSEPEDLTSLRSVKVLLQDVKLRPGEFLVMYIMSLAPVGVAQDAVAWNSFAADVNYTDLDGNLKSLLAIEPEKVGVRVLAPGENTVRIGGYAFADTKGTGTYDTGDAFVNDVGVGLFDETGTLVSATFTAPDASLNPGKYLFNNLPPAKYRVRFFVDKNYKYSKRAEGGNTADANGYTDLIDLRDRLSAEDVHVGIREKSAYNIDEILRANASARSVVRTVTQNQMLLCMKTEDVMDLIKKSPN